MAEQINGRRKSRGDRSGGRAELIDKKPRFGRAAIFWL
jgi:hypothetical protein